MVTSIKIIGLDDDTRNQIVDIGREINVVAQAIFGVGHALRYIGKCVCHAQGVTLPEED